MYIHICVRNLLTKPEAINHGFPILYYQTTRKAIIANSIGCERVTLLCLPLKLLLCFPTRCKCRVVEKECPTRHGHLHLSTYC